MGERCCTLPTLKVMAQQREWKGKPSTTQCLKGTLEAFLLLTVDYFIDPQKAAFRLLGSNHHKLLENTDLPILDEQVFDGEDAEVSGIVDLWDDGTLTDYKTWGSFKVGRALGLYKEDVPTGEIYKSGARKGQAKTRKETRQSPDKVDMDDAVYQLNRYRIFYEKAGFKVNKLQIQATVRDGGIRAATSTGVDRNIYIIPVPILSDEKILTYFKRKSEALLRCMKEKKAKPIDYCTKEERWDGRKCDKYCDVNFKCPVWLKTQKESE